jgi:hypothetical protein
MNLRWRKNLPQNGAAERRLISEARHLGETMTLMVGRMETLVERLHEELENHEPGLGREGGSDERRV